MVLKILLIVSILLQVFAATIAIKLIRVTKYNFSWVLITIALSLLTILRIVDFSSHFLDTDYNIPIDVFVWMGVIISTCFACGVFLIQRIFKHMAQMERKERLGQEKIISTIIKTEENERKRFSKDIHDGLGPLLSSAKLSISALSLSDLDDHQKTIIDNTNLVIDEAIKSLKEISNNINPHILTNFGLDRAINNFIKKIPQLKIHYTSNIKDIRFVEHIEVALYRAICEMINNTLKHAAATTVEISIVLVNKQLTVQYSDDGVGFAMDEVQSDNASGIGLQNIISRIKSLKGEIEIQSEIDNGTLIIIKLADVTWE